MDDSWKKIADLAVATLSPDELERSIVYLIPRLLRKGDSLRIDRKSVTIEAPTVLAFIDLVPAANWGHPCRYLLINPANGETQSMDGEFPPDRAGLRVAHKGRRIEAWMLLTKEGLE